MPINRENWIDALPGWCLQNIASVFSTRFTLAISEAITLLSQLFFTNYVIGFVILSYSCFAFLLAWVTALSSASVIGCYDVGTGIVSASAPAVSVSCVCSSAVSSRTCANSCLQTLSDVLFFQLVHLL